MLLPPTKSQLLNYSYIYESNIAFLRRIMIIALSADEAVVNTTRKLKTLYHPEKAFLMSEIAPPNEDLSQCSEIPIKRITILGHAHHHSFGRMNANEFANQLITILKSNEKSSPGFIKNIEAIDLLGCEIGLNGPDNKGFGSKVAWYLSQAGIHINIYGFSSENQESNTTYTRSLLCHNTNNESWTYLGFSSENDYKTYKGTTKNGQNLEKKSSAIKSQLYDSIKEEDQLLLQNRKMLEVITHFKNNVKIINTTLPTEERKQFEIAVKKGERKLRPIYDSIVKNELKIVELRKTQHSMSEEIETLDKLMDEEHDRLEKFPIIISTKNPRAYFNSHPQCNFMKNPQPPHAGDKTGIFRGRIPRKQVNEDPLYQPTITHKSRH